MDNFVVDTLTEWQLPELIDNFNAQDIDEEAFHLLDEDTIRSLIPKIGPRLKFSKLYRELQKASNALPPTEPPEIHDAPIEESGAASGSMSRDVPNTSPMVEPRAAEPMLVLQPAPAFNITEILSAVPSGLDLVKILEKHDAIGVKERYTLVQILVLFLMERFGEKPAREIKEAMAQSLVQTFPVLKDESATGYELWWTKSRKGQTKDGKTCYFPATGFIEEKLHNSRKRKRSQSSQHRSGSSPGSSQQMTEADERHRAELPEPTTPDGSSNGKREWLKHNLEPFDQVQKYMKDTVLCRARWIRENASKDIKEILAEYPRLTNPGMISQDFLELYGEAAPKLFETWVTEYAEKVLNLAKRDGKLPSFPVDEMSLDAKGELALRLLPRLLPQTVYRSNKKSVRHTAEEARLAFIDLKPVGTNMVEYLLQTEGRPPSVLVLGEPQRCASQAFVIMAGQAFAENTLLGAVDVCFKAFYVFDFDYPKQCTHPWQFLQRVVYNLPGKESNQVAFLRKAIVNTRL